jgi:polyphosphate glucokinase
VEVLGIDIGGSGIKGNVVNTATGTLLYERFKLLTPKPSNPEAVVSVLKKIIDHFSWQSKPLGLGFPAIIKNGSCLSASNVDKSWLHFGIQAYFEQELNAPLVVLNDADAAGIAEYKFGHAKDKEGTVLVLTLGTGIGSALFHDGILVPNTEFGHLLYKKSIFEHYVSSGAKSKRELSYKEWAIELKIYLNHLIKLFSPERIVLGGGISRKFAKYQMYLEDLPVEVIPAKLQNSAGILGAAIAFENRKHLSN